MPVFLSFPILISSILSMFLMPIPVPFTLPGTPILLDSAVGHALMLRRDLAEVRRYAEHRAWHFFDSDASPRTVVVCCPEPLTAVRPVPMSVIEKYVLPHVGRIINVSPRYHEHDRRGRDDQSGQRDGDFDVDAGGALRREREPEYQEQGCDG